MSKTATIMMVHMHVLAILATSLLMMDSTAMVSHQLISNFKDSMPIKIMPVDIDECTEDLANCAQHCTNANGSYSCSCGSCYRLSSDGYSCNSKCSHH